MPPLSIFRGSKHGNHEIVAADGAKGTAVQCRIDFGYKPFPLHGLCEELSLQGVEDFSGTDFTCATKTCL